MTVCHTIYGMYIILYIFNTLIYMLACARHKRTDDRHRVAECFGVTALKKLVRDNQEV